MRPSIQLIHWQAAEAEERAVRLRALGFVVACDAATPGELRSLRTAPPDLFVVDLSRLPMQGRDVMLMLRQSPSLWGVPVVFVGGAEEKVEKVRATFPDAVYATWETIGAAIDEAIDNAPGSDAAPVPARAPSIMEPYAGRPLAAKLGIGEGMTVVLIDAPPEFPELVGELPAGARMVSRGPKHGARPVMTIWFVERRAELEAGIDARIEVAGDGALWIAWPRGASSRSRTAARTDLTLPVIRATARAAGLAESKLCSVDAVWTAVRYTRKRS